MSTMLLPAHLQSILWIHEEVSSDVVKHNGVFPVVKLFILPPYHTQGLHLEGNIPLNMLIRSNHLLTEQQKSARSHHQHSSVPSHEVKRVDVDDMQRTCNSPLYTGNSPHCLTELDNMLVRQSRGYHKLRHNTQFKGKATPNQTNPTIKYKCSLQL